MFSLIFRHEMLAWVNGCLQSQMAKVEELGSGAAYCQLMDMLFPGEKNKNKWGKCLELIISFNVSICRSNSTQKGQIQFKARAWKHQQFQTAPGCVQKDECGPGELCLLSIKHFKPTLKAVDVDKLSKQKFQDNFEFLQWYKKFFDANYRSLVICSSTF